MRIIRRKQLEDMFEHRERFTLVEVLGPEEYDQVHLPGAINVPHDRNFAQAIQRAVPDKRVPVVVYCRDVGCDASPKAGREMEALGYEHVYQYEAGKTDWVRAGLPMESGSPEGPHAPGG